jgi:hypothetical protein
MSFTKRELAECANRELTKRRFLYPKLIERGKLKMRVADAEIAKMQAIYRLIVELPDAAVENNQ